MAGATQRPSNREVENEALRPDGEGRPPRPASEPKGAKASVRNRETATDPGSGEARPPGAKP